MGSLHYTIIDTENNIVEAEFDDNYKVFFRVELYDKNNNTENKLYKTLNEDGTEFEFGPKGIYFALRYLYYDKPVNYINKIFAMGLYKEENNIIFNNFNSCEYKIHIGDTVKCQNWEMKINSFTDMKILINQLRTEYYLLDD